MKTNGRLVNFRFLHQPALLFLLLTAAACQHSEKITLAFLGDINLGRAVSPSAESFAILSDSLTAANLALANLESPLGVPPGIDPTGYNLCASAESASLLTAWGLDLLAIVNNHANDCGSGGIDGTQSALASAGLTGVTSEPILLEINGLHLAFFAFDDISYTLDSETAAEAIRLSRQDGNLVIVSVHWGMEYQGAPNPRQKAVASQLAEAGAHLIWGHHPHFLQSSAWIETTSGRTFVLYSLGNALFDMGGLENTRQSALVLVTMDRGGVRAVEAVPFVIDAPHSRLLEPDVEKIRKILSRLNIE